LRTYVCVCVRVRVRVYHPVPFLLPYPASLYSLRSTHRPFPLPLSLSLSLSLSPPFSRSLAVSRARSPVFLRDGAIVALFLVCARQCSVAPFVEFACKQHGGRCGCATIVVSKRGECYATTAAPSRCPERRGCQLLSSAATLPPPRPLFPLPSPPPSPLPPSPLSLSSSAATTTTVAARTRTATTTRTTTTRTATTTSRRAGRSPVFVWTGDFSPLHDSQVKM